MSERNCARTGCDCRIDTDETYCSATCRTRRDDPGACDCEHLECQGAQGDGEGPTIEPPPDAD
jgi:hypothetical protein